MPATGSAGDRQHLPDLDAARGVVGHEVGERPADVDAEQMLHDAGSLHRRGLWGAACSGQPAAMEWRCLRLRRTRPLCRATSMTERSSWRGGDLHFLARQFPARIGHVLAGPDGLRAPDAVERVGEDLVQGEVADAEQVGGRAEPAARVHLQQQVAVHLGATASLAVS